MADFPTSVFNPASRSAGQTIGSAHMNSVQAEITAIEDGYRNATAPLNSSGSTVATLSVLGGSTFASRPVTPPPEAAKVFIEAVQDLGSSVTSTITSFVGQAYITNSSIHSTGTNPERLTPQSTGLFVFEAQALTRAAPTGNTQFNVQIRDSSGTLIGQNSAGFVGSVGGGMVVQALGLKRYDALGGHMVVSLNIAGAGTTNALSSGVTATWFAMRKV